MVNVEIKARCTDPDRVEGLGTFVEIEANDADESVVLDVLQQQCAHYLALFDIADDALVPFSYSDLLLARR